MANEFSKSYIRKETHTHLEKPMFDARIILDTLATNCTSKKPLIAGMRKIFDEVIVLQYDGPDTLPTEMLDEKYFGIALDLWMDHQPYATAICHNYATESIGQIQESYSDEGTQLSQAIQRNVEGKKTRRIVCTFEYWNPETEVRQFITQATDWFADRIGPVERELGTSALEHLTSINYDLQCEDGPWAMSIELLADGDESHVILTMIIEAHPVTNLRNLLGQIFKRQ